VGSNLNLPGLVSPIPAAADTKKITTTHNRRRPTGRWRQLARVPHKATDERQPSPPYSAGVQSSRLGAAEKSVD
jgi:hypothetical protein